MPISDWITDTGTPVTVIETGLYIDGEFLEDEPISKPPAEPPAEPTADQPVDLT